MLVAQPASALPDWLLKLAGNLVGTHASLVDESRSFTFQYESYDGKKNKEVLSAKVYYHPNTTLVKNIILVCHPTTTTNKEVPTGYAQMDKDVRRLVKYDDFTTVVICPDYCGYGISSHKQHPYLIHDVTARNCVDAVAALRDELLKHDKLWLNSDFSTDIVGYSQGGATALACAKYLDSDACPQEIKNRVKLRQTTCGDGPYSTVATVNKYIEWGKPKTPENEALGVETPDEDLEYACVLPLIVMAAKDAYDDGCMHTVNIEDFFDPQFLSSGIIDHIMTKSVGTGYLDTELSKVMARQRPVDVFSDKIINKQTGEFNTTTNEYKCLMRALDKADLTKGWQPKHPIYFFHLKSDKVVPYANYEAIKAGIEHDYPSMIHYVDAVEAHLDVRGATNHELLGDAVSNGIYGESGVNFFDFTNVNHATGGTIFYVDYMFGRKLRQW